MISSNLKIVPIIYYFRRLTNSIRRVKLYSFVLYFLQSLSTVFILLFLTTAIKSDENGVYFKIEENRFFFNGNENSVWIEKVDSLLSCSQMCARREDCQSANFIKEQRTCSLFSEGRSGYLSGLPDTRRVFLYGKGRQRQITHERVFLGRILFGEQRWYSGESKCGLGSTPGLGVICGLSLLLVLFLALRGFSPGSLVFPSPQKPTFLNSNSIRNVRATALSIVTDC